MAESATTGRRNARDDTTAERKIVIDEGDVSLDDDDTVLRKVGNRAGNGDVSLCTNINTEQALEQGITKGDHLIVKWVDGVLVGIPLEVDL